MHYNTDSHAGYRKQTSQEQVEQILELQSLFISIYLGAINQLLSYLDKRCICAPLLTSPSNITAEIHHPATSLVANNQAFEPEALFRCSYLPVCN